MEKQLALVLAHDIEASMKILVAAIEQENGYLALKAITNAQNEIVTIRDLLELLYSRFDAHSHLDVTRLRGNNSKPLAFPNADE